jgi:hypothetical protein
LRSPLVDIANNLEGRFRAVFVDFARLQGGQVCFPRVAEHIVGLLTGKSHEFSRF